MEEVSVKYLLTEEVAEMLRVSAKTIQRRMKITGQAGIKIPWVKLGRRVLWKKQSIERWVEELEQWQVSEKEAKPPMKLDGEIDMTNKGLKHVPMKKQQTNSSLKSKERRRSGKTGNLRAFAKSLT
jgi:predicted DNA-binding transcriptional regulator AlpA